MRYLVIAMIFFAVIGGAPAANAEVSDADAFRARVAACKTENCLANVAHLFSALHSRKMTIHHARGEYRKSLEESMDLDRAQLHDPDIFVMIEDGRWAAMTEREKVEYINSHWRKK